MSFFFKDGLFRVLGFKKERKRKEKTTSPKETRALGDTDENERINASNEHTCATPVDACSRAFYEKNEPRA